MSLKWGAGLRNSWLHRRVAQGRDGRGGGGLGDLCAGGLKAKGDRHGKAGASEVVAWGG